MFFNKITHKTIKFKEEIDFYHIAKYKTPIISVTDNPSKDAVHFFMAKDDEASVLLSADLKSVGIKPEPNETYFIVRQINTRKTYEIFKLDRELYNIVVER